MKYQWDQLWIHLKFQLYTNGNFNEMSIDINWKSSGNRVAISMKYQCKSIGNQDKIHLEN